MKLREVIDNRLNDNEMKIMNFLQTMSTDDRKKLVGDLIEKMAMSENVLNGVADTHPIWRFIHFFTGEDAKVQRMVLSNFQKQQELLLSVLDVAFEMQILNSYEINRMLNMFSSLLERTNQLELHETEIYRLIGCLASKFRIRIQQLENDNFGLEKQVDHLIHRIDLIEESKFGLCENLGDDYYHDKSILDQAYKDIYTYYEELHKIDGEHTKGIDRSLVLIKKRWDEMKLNAYHVAVVGNIKVGKSTLINALLGEKILSSAILPETATLSLIRYGEDKKAIARFFCKKDYSTLTEFSEMNEAVARIVKTVEESNELKSMIQDESCSVEFPVSQIKKYTSVKNIPPYGNIILKVDIWYPNKLCKRDIVIIDTPGLNDPNPARSMVTERYLSNADAIIMMYTPVFSDSEKQFLKKFIISGDLRKIFVVINRIDDLSNEEIDELINYFRQNIEDIINELKVELVDGEAKDEILKRCNKELKEVRLFKMIALKALKGKINNNPEAVKNSHFPPFEQALEQFVFHGEKNRRFFYSHLQTLYTNLHMGIKICKNIVEFYKFNINDLARNHEQLQSERNELDTERNEIIHQATVDFENVFQDISQRMVDAQRMLINSIEATISRMIDDTHYLKLTGNDLKKRLNAIIQENINREMNHQKKVVQKALEDQVMILSNNIALKFKHLVDVFNFKAKNLDIKVSVDDIMEDTPDLWDTIGPGAVAGVVTGVINVALGEMLAARVSGLIFANLIPYLGTAIFLIVSALQVSKLKNNIKTTIVSKVTPKISKVFEQVLNDGFDGEEGVWIPSFREIIHEVRDEVFNRFNEKYEQSLLPLMSSMEKAMEMKQMHEDLAKSIEPKIEKIWKGFEKIKRCIKPLQKRYNTVDEIKGICFDESVR